MGVKVITETGFFFIAGKNNEQFTFTTAVSVKAGDAFKNDAGQVIGLVVNDVDIDAEDKEPRPVAVLVSGIVYEEKLSLSAEDRAALLSNTSVRFLGGDNTVAASGKPAGGE